jgi:hypothetical protein
MVTVLQDILSEIVAAKIQIFFDVIYRLIRVEIIENDGGKMIKIYLDTRAQLNCVNLRTIKLR